MNESLMDVSGKPTRGERNQTSGKSTELEIESAWRRTENEKEEDSKNGYKQTESV